LIAGTDKRAAPENRAGTVPESPAGAAPAIHVAAGVLVDRGGRVLIAQRPPGKHLAGAWEFPGGKLEPGERPADGLRRELKEEIGVDIERPRPLMRLRHTYAYGEVLLDIWVVRRYRGEPRSLDGQALRWCRRAELADADLLPADRPIVEALCLPERLTRADSPYYELVSLEHLASGSARGPGLRGVFCADAPEAETAAAAGAKFLAMRARLPAAELAALCSRLDVPVFARHLNLERAWELGASGVNDIEVLG
jgi:mutator protein MutT